ncbi:PQQ-like beta-propeller repeat protein [Pelagibacterales bacterium SAG-MED20]|nr:PQQ-like beta-propeller repeat protein [Pelagibacterales bacterium SAG-MED20]
MNNILKIILIFIFVTNCSLSQNSKFWTEEKISIKKETQKNNVKVILKKEKALNLEINPNLKISLYSKPVNKSFLNDFDNNNGRINYSGNLRNISKFKFSKIEKFFQYDPEVSFNNNNIIFFDNKGSILKFDNQSNLIWKKNYYSKSEKKLNPILIFASNKKTLIVADNIAKFYALNIETGELLWSKNNTAPFNSQIKIHKSLFFIVDFENILRAYSLKDGKEIWNLKTENTIIKSQKKLSIVIIDEKIYFNNSLGDISSVDIKTGELIWQSPTQSSLVSAESFFLKTSDIIADKNALYFSNNKNQFFSLDIKTGNLNWQQKANSNLRPTLIDDYIFTVTLEGYLMIINKNDGKIVRVTDVFSNFKAKKRNKIKPTGFIIGKNDIYLTTDHGRLLIIDVNSGLTKSMIKIVNKKISRPSVLNQNLFIISDNSIIKLN